MLQQLSIPIPSFQYTLHVSSDFSPFTLLTFCQDADKGHVQMRDLTLEIVDLR